MRPLILILLLACAARPPGQPNFTGTWKQLEEPRSSQDRRFNTQNRLAQQEQKLSVTTILGANGDRQESTYTREYEIGGEPKVTSDREGDQFTNIVKWEGNSLVFETAEKEKSATLNSREVWTLSADGKTLTKKIHRTGGRGNDSDQTYVLVKQD